MNGKLFTEHFLLGGIRDTSAWKSVSDEQLSQFAKGLEKILAALPPGAESNEALTEDEIIKPVLAALGWNYLTRNQNMSERGREDVPDFLLFPDAQSKASALREKSESNQYRHGIGIVENKRWALALDRGADDQPKAGTPSSQVLWYLRRALQLSNGSIQWGMLTNGRLWRLYTTRARSIAEDYLEIDLGKIFPFIDLQQDLLTLSAKDSTHWLKVFLLLFRHDAFVPSKDSADQQPFHLTALNETRRWEDVVSDDLGQQVFDDVFPGLIRALWKHDSLAPKARTDAYLEDLRTTALTFLYRVLFVFYAEDRNLLPVLEKGYREYSLRAIREDVAERTDHKEPFSKVATKYHDSLATLWRAIAVGDSEIGLPPYNGGLFEQTASSILDRVRLPDFVLAPLIDKLSRGTKQLHLSGRPINYRDLSVQHLGSIYERILERAAVWTAGGDIEIRPDRFARKSSGSYYTHDDLVRLIIEETVGRLIQERVEKFRKTAESLDKDARPLQAKIADLDEVDPATQILSLKVCDPAMGSGHFLVSLVDYLADQVLEHMEAVTEEVDWLPKGGGYRSPVKERIGNIRRMIRNAAETHGWKIDHDQLDDKHIVRRMILKRCIFGVDKNPMAVELAKVALWLHTFTVGAPLSFLDHHLHCGDSLFGAWFGQAQRELEREGGLLFQSALSDLTKVAEPMNRLADLTDASLAEVHESRELYRSISNTLAPWSGFLDFWQGAQWAQSSARSPAERIHDRNAAHAIVSGRFGNPMDVTSSGKLELDEKHREDSLVVQSLLERATEAADREHFLHWEVDFPTVWRISEHGVHADGGFDAVIGNPPWDRMKLQQVEWFALRRPEIAGQTRAADRKRMIQELQETGDPLWRDYQIAQAAADASMTLARKSGEYPLLSAGDINIYSLFVERAQALIKPNGIVGFLTPSGIASDLGASEFFRSVSETGRLAAIYDFENRFPGFFPDVDSRFKFCALVYGGATRKVPETRCAFFLHSVAELRDPKRSFTMRPVDFQAVNPNTGTAPIFRSRRDAELTVGIYQRHPILVRRHKAGKEDRLWPVCYLRMFDMTNDSQLFKRGAELQDAGFYPVDCNCWKKGKERYVPLYEGKMVQMYDHRAASVTVNPANIHNPASSDAASTEERRNPEWLPNPQYWVPEADVRAAVTVDWLICYRDIARTTDVRTMIATIAPCYGFGNTLPLLLPLPDAESRRSYISFAPLLVANLGAFACDFLLRQKVQSTHVNLYILEQLPLIAPTSYESTIGKANIGDFIRDQVLRLTFTSQDMKPFARDMGYKGKPFRWDEEDRRHRMARLDALFFNLYGIGKDDADYILEQFPIVKKQDEQEFHRFRTKELILAYMNAIEAGDLETVVDL